MARPERLLFLNRADHAPKLRDTVNDSTTNGYVLTWDSSTQGWYPSDAGSGGTSAPSNASYFLLASNESLPNARTFVTSGGVKSVDGGTGEQYTMSIGFDSGEASGDMLLRGPAGYTRLGVGSTANVLQVTTSGGVAWDKARVADPMVWASSELCYKRDGTRILATIPYDAGTIPASASLKLRCVLSAAVAGVTLRVRLYNSTDGEYVTDASLSTTSMSPTTFTSSALTIGSSSGNLKNTLKAYEVHADVTAEDASALGVIGFVGLSMQ